MPAGIPLQKGACPRWAFRGRTMLANTGRLCRAAILGRLRGRAAVRTIPASEVPDAEDHMCLPPAACRPGRNRQIALIGFPPQIPTASDTAIIEPEDTGQNMWAHSAGCDETRRRHLQSRTALSIPGRTVDMTTYRVDEPPSNPPYLQGNPAAAPEAPLRAVPYTPIRVVFS